MFEELRDQVCMITGGAGGIGKATARLLGSVGMKIFITDISDEVIGKALEDLRAGGVVCDGASGNNVDPEAVQAMVDKCVGTFGVPYALVNCAGIYKDCYFKDMGQKDWHQTIDINLNGTWNVTKAVGDLMIREGRGNIVSLTSQAGISGSVMHVHYSASKAGIIGITTTLARELAQYGIRVNCVAPGIIKTNMTNGYSPERQQMFYRQIPLGRFGEPEEAAKVILFLVSDLSSYMTGQTLNVTGGWLLHS